MSLEHPFQPLIKRGLLHRLFKGAAVLLGLAFLVAVGWLYYAFRSGRAAELVREQIVTGLRDACGLKAEFSSLTLDPLARTLDLEALRIENDGHMLVSVEQVLVTVRLLPLLYGRVALDRVAALGPQAALVVQDGALTNLPGCLAGESEGAPVALGIRELTVERGRFELTVDRDLHLSLRDIGLSLGESPTGSTDLALGVDDGVLEYENRSQPFKLRVLGHLEGPLSHPRAVVLDDARVGLGKLELKGSGSVDLLGPVFNGKVKVDLPLEILADFLPEAPPASGLVSMELSLAGTPAAPRAAGTLVAEEVTIAGVGLGDRAVVEIAADRSGVTIGRAEIKVQDGVVVAAGRIGLSSEFPIELDADVDGLGFGPLLDKLGVHGAWINFSAEGATHLAGTLNPVALEGPFDFLLSGTRVTPGPWDATHSEVMLALGPTHVAGQWRFEPSGLTFSDTKLETGRTEGRVDARLDLALDRINLTTNFASFDFADLGPIAGLAIQGSGTISGELSGPLEKLRGTGSFELDGASIAEIPLGRLAGSLDWHDFIKLDLSALEGELGESKYTGSVRVTFEGDVPLHLDGELVRGRLEDLLLPFGLTATDLGDASGKLVGRWALYGPIDRLTGPLELSGQALSFYGEVAESARALGRMENGALIIEALELDKHGARINGGGQVDLPRGRLELWARVKGARLGQLEALAEQKVLQGGLDAELSLGGPYQSLTGTLSVALSALTVGGLPLGDAQVKGSFSGPGMSLEGTLVRDNALLLRLSQASLEFREGTPYRAFLELPGADVPEIVAAVLGHRQWNGHLAGSARLSGNLGDWRRSSGVVELTEGRLRLGKVEGELAGASRLVVTKGLVETKRLAVTAAKTRIVAAGKIGAEEVGMHLEGRMDLSLLEGMSSIERAGGWFVFDSSISGRWSAPNLVGSGRVEGGLLEWRGVEGRLTGFGAELTFSQSSIFIDRSEGRWAGGKVGLAGRVDLADGGLGNLGLVLTVTEVQPRYATPWVDLFGQLNGRLTIEGSPKRVVVRGGLQVRQGRLKPKIDLSSMVGNRALAAAYDPSRELIEFDIGVRSVDNLRVKSDDVDLELRGDFSITGTNERFGMLGAVNVLQGGRVSFLGRDYQIEGGLIEFRDRLRFVPRYDLALISEACTARIRVSLVGSFEKVELSYSSSPAMEENDIVSCLLRGVRERGVDSDLYTFAGSTLLKLSGVDRQVKKVLPIDQIDVATEYSSQSRAYEPRLMLAKDLTFLDRPARLEYSSSLLNNKDQRAALKVRLTPRLNLQLGWTSSEDVPYGDWGVDLKQRWEW